MVEETVPFQWSLAKKASRHHRTTIIEEHISIVNEPNCTYLGHFTPVSGSDKKNIVKKLFEFG